MAKTSKQYRKEEKVNKRLTENEKDINILNQEVNTLKKKYDQHIVRHIIDDLNAETFPGSNRALYTYENIADRYNTSASTVSRIADENGLRRRNKKNS